MSQRCLLYVVNVSLKRTAETKNQIFIQTISNGENWRKSRKNQQQQLIPHYSVIMKKAENQLPKKIKKTETNEYIMSHFKLQIKKSNPKPKC